MDKKIEKLLKEYGLTADMLQNTQEKIEIDLSGCREEIESWAEQLELSIEEDGVRNAGGGDYAVITGTAASIVTLLQMLQTAYGAGFEIGITSFVGAAAITSAMPAIKLIMDKIRKRNAPES